jgi:hypothetical protein
VSRYLLPALAFALPLGLPAPPRLALLARPLELAFLVRAHRGGVLGLGRRLEELLRLALWGLALRCFTRNSGRELAQPTLQPPHGLGSFACHGRV